MIDRTENRLLSTPTEVTGPVWLRLFGPFRLTLPDGRDVPITTKKNRALLAVLALSPGGQATRDRLCELLWGDRADEQARSSLRQSLAVMRKELGEAEALLLRTREDIIILRPIGLSVDAVEFLKLAKASDAPSLRRASEHYSGVLLADTSVKVPAFEEWLAAERRRLEDQAIIVLEMLNELQTGQDRIATAKRLVDLDPLREASHRALMDAYYKIGENGLALRQYETCQELLKSELGVEPARQTRELKQKIAEKPAGLEATPRPIENVPSVTNDENRRSIAVLPFTNLSGDPEQQYFADGLTEDLITDLSKLPNLFVIAAHSAFKYRSAATEVTTAARQLGVRFVVLGSIRRVIDRLRFNAQLVDANSGAVLWADRYDRDFAKIYDLQAELATKIWQAVFGPLSAANQVGRYKSPSLEAFDLCMKGRNEFRHSDEAGTRARHLFERVIELDPNYSEAYRWLALGENLSWLHFGQPMYPTRERSLSNARKAVELDPSDSAAHWILGFVIMNEGKLDESAVELETALRLNPNDADAWNVFSDLLVMEGRGREAVEYCERSLLLNPQPLAFYYWLYGQAQFAAGDYEAAIQTLRREETYRTGSRRILAAALAMLGRTREAIEEGRLFMSEYPHFKISYWAETQPFRDLEMRDRFVEAYRLAGLPE